LRLAANDAHNKGARRYVKIRILTSCTGEKAHSPDNQLTQDDFRLLSEPARFQAREDELSAYRTPADAMYTGQQHLRLMEGVRAFREQHGAESVDVWVLSAGYGLLPGDQAIAPYECTFQGMKATEIDAWAAHLHVPEDARRFFAQPADLVLVLLGDDYLRALGLGDDVTFAAPTLFFTGKASQKRVRGQGTVRAVVLTRFDTRRFSSGMVSLKGEVARRFLRRAAEDSGFLAKILDSTINVLDVLYKGE